MDGDTLHSSSDAITNFGDFLLQGISCTGPHLVNTSKAFVLQKVLTPQLYTDASRCPDDCSTLLI